MTRDDRVSMFRAGPLRADLDARTPADQSFVETVRRDLTRYYFLLPRALPTFSDAEASLIVDALNGTIFHPETIGLLWAEIDEAVRNAGLAEKWRVDGAALVSRLRDLSFVEALAIVDAVERFWRGPYRQEGPMRERLLAVGLVKE
jgi:hypothetical protein